MIYKFKGIAINKFTNPDLGTTDIGDIHYIKNQDREVKEIKVSYLLKNVLSWCEFVNFTESEFFSNAETYKKKEITTIEFDSGEIANILIPYEEFDKLMDSYYNQIKLIKEN